MLTYGAFVYLLSVTHCFCWFCVFGYSLIPEIYEYFCQMPVKPYLSGTILVQIQGSGFPRLLCCCYSNNNMLLLLSHPCLCNPMGWHKIHRGAYVETEILKGRLEMKKHPVSGTKPCLGCSVWSPGGAGGGAAWGYLRSDESSLRGRENKSSVSEKYILSETVSSFCAESVCLFDFTFGFKLQEQLEWACPCSAICLAVWGVFCSFKSCRRLCVPLSFLISVG